MDNGGIGSWPHRRQRGAPDTVALVDTTSGVELTWGEVAERANRSADVLRRAGVGAGDRVAFLGRNRAELLEVLVGATSLGAIFVPLNWRLAAQELSFVIDDCAPSVLIHDVEFGDTVARVSGMVDTAPGLIAPLGPTWRQRLADADPTFVDVPIGLDDPAMIIYTSGTTGRPKGAVLTHGNVTWNCVNTMIDVGVSADSVALVCAPMFHVAALNMVAMPAVLAGSRIVLTGGFDPAEVLELIPRHRVTLMFGVPAMFNALAQQPGFADADLSTLEHALCGGAPVPLRTITTWSARGVSFLQGYGMTETSPGALFLGPRKAEEKAGTAGVPMFFTDVEVRRPDGSEVEPGERGEVVVKGPVVMRGYWQRPDATDEVIRDGWFRSGDIAVVDEDGYVTIVDRLKDMYISGGENVYPAEIENALFEHPDIAEAAVIGVPDDRWGEVGMAVLVPVAQSEVAPPDVQAYLAERLAGYKVPKYVTVVDELPRTGAGKVQKRKLREQLKITTQETPRHENPDNRATPRRPARDGRH